MGRFAIILEEKRKLLHIAGKRYLALLFCFLIVMELTYMATSLVEILDYSGSIFGSNYRRKRKTVSFCGGIVLLHYSLLMLLTLHTATVLVGILRYRSCVSHNVSIAYYHCQRLKQIICGPTYVLGLQVSIILRID